MNKESGSAVVIVMGVLLIISLLGAGLLLQTRYDTRFTQSISRGDQTFLLADGALDLAAARIFLADPDRQQLSYDGKPMLKGASTGATDKYGGTSVSNTVKAGNDASYSSNNLLLAVESTRKPGYNAPGFYDQFWIAEGRGNTGIDASAYSVGKGQIEAIDAVTIVQLAVSRTAASHYGDY